MFVDPTPVIATVDVLAFDGGMVIPRYGCTYVVQCQNYIDTGNPHFVSISSNCTCDTYEYPNNSWSNGRQVYSDSTYGKIVSRTFIFN